MTTSPPPLDAGSKGTLLIVDDDENVVSALRRMLRQEGYRLLTASSGEEGLSLLRHEWVDVMMSDQRMPKMTGVEFLREAKLIAPDTIRIMLSGYTELASVTDAINEGAIYKFLTKPWDDALLKASIAEAFERKALTDENRRLNQQVKVTKDQLMRHNERLTQILEDQKRSMELREQVLRLAKDGLDQLPIPVIGIDRGDRLAFVNQCAQNLAEPGTWKIGERTRDAVPTMIAECIRIAPVQFTIPDLFGQEWILDARVLGSREDFRGIFVTLVPMKPIPQVGRVG